MSFNLSGSLNAFRLLWRPSLCLPHHTVATFAHLPIPLDRALSKPGRPVDIRAVVLDKDDCFAYPEATHVYKPYESAFEALKAAYPGRRLLIVSNTAGTNARDPNRLLADEVERETGVTVLSHAVRKPGCGDEIMAYFRKHPETGVTSPSQVAIVGDRLATDVMMANLMGSWAFWLKDGVVPMKEKSVISRMERPLSEMLFSRGLSPPNPAASSPFE